MIMFAGSGVAMLVVGLPSVPGALVTTGLALILPPPGNSVFSILIQALS